MIYDPRGRRVLELRPDAQALWPLFDGSSDLESLAEEMAEVSTLDLEGARDHLATIVAELAGAGLLEDREPPPGTAP